MSVGISKGLAGILTKEKLGELYFSKGMSFLAIARVYGCKNSNIAYYFRKYGLKGRSENGSFRGASPWNKGQRIKDGTLKNTLYIEASKTMRRRYGKDHHNYKGGWIQARYKYICVAGRQVAEHRYLMEQFLGRQLSLNEVVHHRNGNRLDNRLENLELMTRAQHINHHRQELTNARFWSD